MDTLTSLRVFCRVAELKSFTGAADRLDMSPTMASRHVRYLEDRLGTRLLNRTSRHVSLTESGTLYFDQAKQTLEALEDVEAAVGNSTAEPRGTLKLSAPVWFVNARFSRVIAEFDAAYPQVRLDLHLSGRMVNLVEEGFDLAFRVAAPGCSIPVSSLARWPICRSWRSRPLRTWIRTGRPATLSESEWAEAAHVFRWLGRAPSSRSTGREGQRKRSGSMSACRAETNLCCISRPWRAWASPSSPRSWSNATWRRDDLRRSCPASPSSSAKIYAVYPSRKFLSAKVRTFIDFFSDKIQSFRDERQHFRQILN